MKNNTLTWRVKQLEKKTDKMLEMLVGDEGLLTNHIPHIQQEMTRIGTRVNVLTLVNVGAIIIALMINKFL